MKEGYALLIGVNDYNAHGDGCDLLGSLDDVSLWWKMCRELGYPPENIRVLTSPALASADLHGAYTGTATHDEIVKGVRWLAANLGEHRDAVGLLTFSGCGDQVDQVPVICPTDTAREGSGLANVVRLLDLKAIVAEAGAAPALTVVLDCCYSRRPAVGTRLPLALREHEGAAPPIPAIGDRVFYAAEYGGGAYQGQFLDGRWHGAFTWAFMTTRAQWSLGTDLSDHRTLTISCAEMRRRTQSLLDALTIVQRPGLYTPAGKAEDQWPVFGTAPGATYGNPHFDPPPDDQVDPTQYTFAVSQSPTTTGVNLGLLLAIGANSIQINGAEAQTNMEYWFMNGSTFMQVLGKLGQTWYLQIQESGLRGRYSTPSGDTLYTPIAEYPPWTQSLPLLQPAAGSTSLLFFGQTVYDGTLGPVLLPTWLQFIVSSSGALQAVAWYLQWGTNPNSIPNFAVDPGSSTAPGNNLLLTTAGPSGTYWGTSATMTT